MATFWGALTVALGVLLGSSSTAMAETPVDLNTGYVTDLSGVLSDSAEQKLEQQLGELAAADDRPELYVVLVPRFEGPDNALAWADQTALRNNLAPDQYLLAIATDGRTLAISAEYGGDGTEAGPLSESRVLEIEDQLGSDYLSKNDWAGGIQYVGDEFQKVPWPWWVWVLGLGALALLVFVICRLVLFLRRRAALAAELRTLEGQKKRAALLLVRADEAVRTSEQEIGFVTAEFGEDTTVEFSAVLQDARSKLQQAFQLLEKLQDATPDTPQETRSWTNEIIRICAEVDRALETRTKKLAALRDLAKNAAETLERLKTARADATRTQADAEARLETLTAAFSPAELVGVAGNPREIAERLHDADEELVALESAVQARKPRAISDSVHEIERLLAEVTGLRDAIRAQSNALSGSTSEDAPAEAASTAALPVTVDRASWAVRAAQSSVRARPGGVSATTLSRLNQAERHLTEAQAATDPAEQQRLAAAALGDAERVQGLIGARSVPQASRFTVPAPASDGRLMYETSPASSLTPARRIHTADPEPSRAGQAVWGAISGGAFGVISGLNIAGNEPGALALFLFIGVMVGALIGAFGRGGGGGGSSSGWGGSSSSSHRSSSSRSSFSSSSSSRSSSSSSSRSSGRSGGRRF